MSTVQKVLSVAPTLDTNAYASGDRMGSLVTISGASRRKAGSLRIISAHVLDLDKQNAQFDILLFNASPTIASADNAAIDFTDGNAAYLVGVIPIVTADYTTAFGSNSQATKFNINLMVKTASDSTDLYALLVSRGSPTYSASGLTIKLGIEQC